MRNLIKKDRKNGQKNGQKRGKKGAEKKAKKSKKIHKEGIENIKTEQCKKDKSDRKIAADKTQIRREKCPKKSRIFE